MKSETFSIIPDYKKNPCDVFKEVAVSYIVNRKQLRMLSCKSQEPTSTKTPEIPSWVPDWESRADRLPFLSRDIAFVPDSEEKPSIQLSSGNILSIKDKLLCRISPLGRLESHNSHFEELDKDYARGPLGFVGVSQVARDRLKWLLECHEGAFGEHRVTLVKHDPAADDSFFLSLTCDIGENARIRRHCTKLPAAVEIMVRLTQSDTNVGVSADERVFVAAFIDNRNHTTQPLAMSAMGRRFCWSDTGHLGMVPKRAELEDAIVVLYGRKFLYVLRPDGEDHYRLIRECSLHGFMYGEAIKRTDLPAQDFHIR